MKEIKLWKIKEDANSELNVENIQSAKET